MQRKFECKNCHTQFEADDQTMVICPNCQSDNVDYISRLSMKKTMKWGASLILVICLAILSCILFKRCNNNSDVIINPPSPQENDSLVVIGGDTIDIDIPEEIVEPPTIASSSLKWEDGGYSFIVEIGHKPTQPYYVAVVEHRGTKEIARSEDGKTFKKVPPSDGEEGIYDLVVFESDTQKRLTSIEKTGFTPPVSQRMTKEQLQALIDNDDESLYGIHKQIAENCKLVFTGLPSDAKKPATLADVMMHIGRMWSAVQVENIQYDSENRISAVTLHVTMAE